MIEQDPNTPIADIYSKSLVLFQSGKDRFAQGYYQYAKDGNKCPWKDGYSFCAIGALVFFGDGFSHRATCCLQRVSEHLFGEAIQAVNDSPGGYEKVQQALKFAIELWDGRQPTEEELGMKIPELLSKRNAE